MVMIVTLRPFRGDEGFVPPKSKIDVSEKRADQLVKKGLATYMIGAKMVPAPQNKMLPAAPQTKEVPQPARKAAKAADPTTAAPTGSPTGAVRQRSSSRAARRRKKPA